jgi:hypothetical protein
MSKISTCTKNLNIWHTWYLFEYYFVYLYFLRVLNLVSDIKRRTWTKAIWAQDAQENISTEGELKVRSLEKTA